MLLFLAALFTATTLGACWSLLVRTDVETDLAPILTPRTVAAVWGDRELLGRGLLFALPALLILLCHELGHVLACRHHGLEASPPYFLPAPIGLGTFGAFIRIRTPMRDRRQLLDVGVWGPIAGFLALLPVLACGVWWSTPRPLAEAMRFGVPVLLYRPGESLLLAGLTRWAHGPMPDGWVLNPHPLLLAGWLGLFATMLNLLPLAQLDGGHILYALVGRGHRRAALPVWIALAALGFAWPGWWLWCAMVLVLGLRHPRLSDETVLLDRRHRGLAAAAGVIFVAGFMPVPIRVLELSPIRGAAPISARRLDVEDESHRAVVEQGDLHPGAELAALDAQAALPQPRREFLDQRSRELGLRRLGERRPPPVRERRAEGELGDDQDGAGDRGQV